MFQAEEITRTKFWRQERESVAHSRERTNFPRAPEMDRDEVTRLERLAGPMRQGQV